MYANIAASRLLANDAVVGPAWWMQVIIRSASVAFPDAVGLVGVVLYVAAYAALQMGILGLTDARYTVLNAFGGIAVIFSLMWSFNLAAFVTQVFWLIFTVVGFVRSRRT